MKLSAWQKGNKSNPKVWTGGSFVLFWAVVSAVYAVVFVGVEFEGSPVNSLTGMFTLARQWVVVSASAAMVIGLLAVNRWVFAVSFPLLLAASAIAAYFRLTMGLSLTPALIELTMINDWNTRLSVVSVLLVLAVTAALAVAAVVVWIRLTRVRKPRHGWAWAALFALGTVAPINILKQLRDPVSARMPYSFYASVKGWLDNRQTVAEGRTTYDNTPVSCPDDAPDVVVVIGESLRPDHLQLNGYGRPTTPRLAADMGVVSFPSVTTEWLYTHVSVPHIMTRKDPEGVDDPYSSQSFITLMNRAGYRSAWVSNQDEVKTYAYFMHEADTLVQCNVARTSYIFEKWLDSDMLPHLDRLMSDRSGGRQLTVIHMIGSHWWYPTHYPDSSSRFKPEVDSRIVSELTREQIINSYDNTVVATDAFLADVTDRLRGRNAVMIFISDHGEALGEDGNYLHAGDYQQVHHTACLVWTSPEYSRRYPAKVAALRRNAGEPFTTEAIFHTVLEAAGVETPVSDPGKSLFKNHDTDKSNHAANR